ncbi:hypothetical protein Afil01_13760 [Actinorhabdospora filicis]|uniref:Uncharacterized protein n=1 Tax=Actinorhabdospora filicis TaxID=1785913 RepID=A0A9W6SJ83_9ACTN|nr:hypothetical protein Afil01_13760 [Actinorhabdospora filicis]
MSRRVADHGMDVIRMATGAGVMPMTTLQVRDVLEETIEALSARVPPPEPRLRWIGLEDTFPEMVVAAALGTRMCLARRGRMRRSKSGASVSQERRYAPGQNRR